jgi:hypothetical protein
MQRRPLLGPSRAVSGSTARKPPSRTLTIDGCGDVLSFLTASVLTVKPASEEGWAGDKRSRAADPKPGSALRSTPLYLSLSATEDGRRDLVVPCALAPSGPPHRSLASLDPAAAKLQQHFDPARGRTPQCALAGLCPVGQLPQREQAACHTRPSFETPGHPLWIACLRLRRAPGDTNWIVSRPIREDSRTIFSDRLAPSLLRPILLALCQGQP